MSEEPEVKMDGITAYMKAVEAERTAFIDEAAKREIKCTFTAEDLKDILDAVAALPVEQQCRSYIPVEQGGTGAMLHKPVPKETTEEKQYPEDCSQLLKMERLDKFKNDPESRPACLAEVLAVKEVTRLELARLDAEEEAMRKTMRENDMSQSEYDRVADKVASMASSGIVIEKNRAKGGLSSLAAALQQPAVAAVPPEQKVETYIQEVRPPRKRNRPKRVYVTADELFRKADALKAELAESLAAWNAKNTEWQAVLELARKQKKYEKRQEYQERNRERRLQQAGHVVPVKQLDPAQLEENPDSWTADDIADHQADVDFHRAMEREDLHRATAPAADNGEKKAPPPGGKVAPKDKRVKR